MITIEQLLESVDLDFEPRWVTKDKNGCIALWGNEKPSSVPLGQMWIAQTDLFCFHGLKLSEFDGKDWTECIYEVPRKTTGDIKKIETMP